jgi:cysteinyl-tRNA synthetase
MIKKHLGDTIDLHTGGVDLLFPHHENEIAQSQCCNGASFARHWFHTEHLLVDGTTMSRSKGNYYTLGDLVAKGHSPMTVRYALLTGHPRKQLNFTLDSLRAAESALATLHGFQQALAPAAGPTGAFAPAWEALRDDLNVPAALGAIFTVVNRGPSGVSRAELDQVLQVLGLVPGARQAGAAQVPPAVASLADRRWAAKRAKDFKGADLLRAELAAAGWSMLDGKDGYRLEPLTK